MGSAQHHIEFSKRAKRDLRALPADVKRQVLRRIAGLEPIPPIANLDILPVEGHAPWLRLRAGDYRVLFRRLTRGELDLLVLRRGALDGDSGYLIGRVVDRAQLIRAVDTLDVISIE